MNIRRCIACVFLILLYACNGYSQAATAFRVIREKAAGRLLVGLGEEGHGYESINRAKASIAGYLRDSLQYGHIIFESPFIASVLAYLDKMPPEERMQHSLYSFWTTSAVIPFFDGYCKAEKETGSQSIAGCDPQEGCLYIRLGQYLCEQGLVRKSKSALLQADSLLGCFIGAGRTENKKMTATELRLLLDNYRTVQQELEATMPDTLQQNLWKRCLENRIWLCSLLHMQNMADRMHYRDSLMAENTLWIWTNLYQRQKTILWAANLHIARQTGHSEPQWMGAYLSALLPENYYALSFSHKSAGNDSFVIRLHEPGQKFDADVYVDREEKIDKQYWKPFCE